MIWKLQIDLSWWAFLSTTSFVLPVPVTMTVNAALFEHDQDAVNNAKGVMERVSQRNAQLDASANEQQIESTSVLDEDSIIIP